MQLKAPLSRAKSRRDRGRFKRLKTNFKQSTPDKLWAAQALGGRQTMACSPVQERTFNSRRVSIAINLMLGKDVPDSDQ